MRDLTAMQSIDGPSMEGLRTDRITASSLESGHIDVAAPGTSKAEVLCRVPGMGRLVRAALVALVVWPGFVSGCGRPSPKPKLIPILPTDAQSACPLSSTTFAGWFQPSSVSSGGTVALNGIAVPANSLTNLTPNCGFYQWGEQMFLWLTSPAPSAYGGGAHIFDSAAFYDVSPLSAGSRTLLSHTPGFVSRFPLRAAQVGVHGLPVILDTARRLLEVRPVNPKLRPMVRDVKGKVVAVAHARLERGKPVLLDAKGNPIETDRAGTAKPETPVRANINPLIVQKFVIDGIIIFIDPSLEVIDVEQGQSDSGVLEAQTTANGSLIYYATMVNDVYAYFLTGVAHNAFPAPMAATSTAAGQFPTTQTDLTNILNFAAANGKAASSFPDPNALAIEVKSSWVLAAGLPNVGSYVTMTATVPTYNQSSPTVWTPTGQQTVQLALVGMHVVGSTAGHPEMVWATFEHQGNTPLATYSYSSQSNGTVTVNQPSTGTWLFTASGSAGPFNVVHMTEPSAPNNGAIQAVSGSTISPSDTLRTDPFGMAGNNTSSNTQILSTIDQVQQFLASGDVRANYFLVGATWTPFGSNPVGANPGVGTNLLANSTMETYEQGTNCFSCHQNTGTQTIPTTQISHMFGALKPLF
jgi:hypothetical protein